MKTALCIIAICEVIRAIQNLVPMIATITERKSRVKLNNAFIDSLRQNNKEWVKSTLEEFKKEHEGE